MGKSTWYQNGLKFECTECGNCCTGAPGYVWVNKEEIAALAKEVNAASIEEFEHKYVRAVGIRKSLKELPHSNWDCVFFDNQSRRCRVYHARPRQCRTWPFWDSNLRDEDSWEETCRVCPGSGSGKLHDVATIEQQRQQIRI